jgi:hypothetical protein
MAETSNPRMKIHVELACGCGRNFEMKYQDPRPELDAETTCALHGATYIEGYTAVGA